MSRLTVVKVGGNIIDNPTHLADFIEKFAKLPGRKILVHGGGKEATRLSKALGVETTMIEGRRVTDRETLDIVTMVYAGLINKRIVSLLQTAGCNAVGLCGADACVISADRRNPEPIDYGFVGDIDFVDAGVINQFLDLGLTPVFSAIAYDKAGGLLNCNADSIASAVAVAMSAVTVTDLIFCFEKAGVLADMDNPDSVIEKIDTGIFSRMKADGTVSDGMIPKITNALKAIAQGVSSVTLKHASNLLNQTGTLIVK